MATRLRNVRVADPLWSAARARAERDGTSLSAVIVAALERYVGRQQPVRCEHEHDVGRPHELSPDCRHPHFV